MDVVAYDAPVLIIAAILLVWLRFRAKRHVFVVAAQVIGLFQGSFTWIVVWSLGSRLMPFMALTAPTKLGNSSIRWFYPFFLYVILNTLLQSPSWQIPPGVMPAYGEYRFAVQIVTFALTGLTAAWAAGALRHPDSAALIHRLLTIAVIIHGLASVYQLIASESGLPLLGISRGHQSELDLGIVDAAGATRMRPGGLAGEPKTAASIFGFYLVMRAFGPLPSQKSDGRLRGPLDLAALLLSVFGVVAALSTSAFFGIGLTFVLLALRFPTRVGINLVRLAVIAAVAVAAWSLLRGDSTSNVNDVIEERTLGRMRGEELDAPVQISLDAVRDDPLIAIFGTGLGGSSFIIMRHLGAARVGLAANVGAVFYLVETGIFGMLLLCLPAIGMALTPLPPAGTASYTSSRLCLALGVGVFIICLAGTGIPTGIGLGIAALVACRDICDEYLRSGDARVTT